MANINDARPLFEAGKSVNAVSRELGISWYDADKLKKAWTAEREPEITEAETEDASLWDVTIQVPAVGIDSLLGKLDHDEAIAALLSLDVQAKCTLWGTVMQRRINAMLTESEAA